MSLEILRSERLAPIEHGFFTRRGGASSGIFQGLNCGTGNSDLADVVRINRDRVAQAMGVETLNGVHQIHSADVVTLKDPITGAKPKADALVTNVPGQALSILTADCQPVLFADPDAQVIGAAHAGWRGTVSGVLESTVEAMEALGAKRSAIRAVIGPSISQDAYEVGPELRDEFLALDSANDQFFAKGHGDRFMFDLPGYGVARLRASGVGVAEWSGHCTYSDPERFFSYRRSTHAKEADYGRLIAVIKL